MIILSKTTKRGGYQIKFKVLGDFPLYNSDSMCNKIGYV